MKHYDFLIVGGGIFGICTALSLANEDCAIALINPDNIPHPLAASTDISKVIRMEYGSDIEYMNMAIRSMDKWRHWNDEMGEKLFHEVGYLLVSGESFDSIRQDYEKSSYEAIVKRGFSPERLGQGSISERFPAFKEGKYRDGFFHEVGGYAESGLAVEVLTNRAREMGVDIDEGQTAEILVRDQNRVTGVKTREGRHYKAGHVIIAAGNFTPYLLPELKTFMKITGHPVFHLKPSQPDLFEVPKFTVFAADIANSGWYGFPLHPVKKVVKIARHSEGLELHPEKDERKVYREDEDNLREFLKSSLPSLAGDPIVYTRRCCYTDTLDGHYWIDSHPDLYGLTVCSGGSGHGFKMGPVVGEMTACVASGRKHGWSDRYSWRNLSANTIQSEEARFLTQRRLI